EVYARALDELFRGHRPTAAEWEQTSSRVMPLLDKYQQDGYHRLIEIADTHGGALLCDAVGLGKTFVGLMLIERLVMHDNKRVLLLVPKSANEDVWRPHIDRYLPAVATGGPFSNLWIMNHTDIGRTSGNYPRDWERIKEMADVIIIDEAHHFRNPGYKGTTDRTPSRYRQLAEIAAGKQLYMFTATPINNKLDDLRHMVELFTGGKQDYFRYTLGIHNLQAYFRNMEKNLMGRRDETVPEDQPTLDMDMIEVSQLLVDDRFFQELVVQRSRAYVKRSQLQAGAPITAFPQREAPRVADYSIKKTYGRLLDDLDGAFAKTSPLFILGIYYPYYYYTGPDENIDAFTENRQKEVVGLIRTQFLKRFESSVEAFERSCERLLLKLLVWLEKHIQTTHEKQRYERWRMDHQDLIGYVQQHQLEFEEEEAEADEDLITEEMLEQVDELPRDEYDVEKIMADTYEDLDTIAIFLRELQRFEARHDDKLQALIKLLKRDPDLKDQKVLIFTEFADTARYLKKHLEEAGFENVAQIDGASKENRSVTIRHFAPYYNGSDSATEGDREVQILISTDVLSEGLNLQDAQRLINYDLHWNPVRLMQRIGRVDRRLNPEIEERLLADHPELADTRGTIIFWNFLPPEELEVLLRLYKRVSNKTLRISKTLGIEGKKLLTPDDDYEALREFNEAYEGSPTEVESLKLEHECLLQEHPDLRDMLDALPGRVFSGKEHPQPGTRAVFFCYRVPRPDKLEQDDAGPPEWTEAAGQTFWILYDVDSKDIIVDPSRIAEVIRSEPDTPRVCATEPETLREIRLAVEGHIKNTILKQLQAPIGVKPILKAWMELN
ncbi:MAG: DEAD/DEAH box helicase, partial [Armatimonadetes bacterium]|nr:DEAD/DEAH box helicase [Armatimonadota bacterium]